MTFDNLISLLLFLLFIVIPILNRLGRANQEAQRPRPSNPQPPARPLVAADTERRQPDGDFARRLEEARRRVQEAQAREAQQRSATPQVAPAPAPKPSPQRRAAAPSQPPTDPLKTAQAPLRLHQPARRPPAQLVVRGTVDEIRRGFIWHFILEEPKAKQLRRRLSQRPLR